MNKASLPIAAVERDTGISKDTLRVWERRYDFPAPERDAKGERLYPAAQVEKLRIIRRLIDQGLRPRNVVPKSTAELTELLDATAAPQPQSDTRLGELLDLLRLHRSDALRQALQQQLLKSGLQRFISDVIAPLNTLVGEAWMRGDIGVPEEHLYTEQVQNLVRSAIAGHTRGDGRPRLLLTTPPDESHVLGLLMVEAMLVPEGVHCISLGTRTPVADVAQAATDGRADVVAISFSAAFPVRQATAYLNELAARLPEAVDIWAGGAALRGRPKLPARVSVIAHIDEVFDPLTRWRAENGGVAPDSAAPR